MSIVLQNSIKSIAIGSFDGLHFAHQELTSQVDAMVIVERNGLNGHCIHRRYVVFTILKKLKL